jgi:AcrR family transcriptional regulator
METRTRDDWLRAARLALLHHGPEGVRVEPLARELAVTKGSFYWHFKDRGALLEALLDEWETEPLTVFANLDDADRPGALEQLLAELRRRTLASERGDEPSDAAIFAWAAIDKSIASRVRKGEQLRINLFAELTGQPDLALLFYYAYHGFLLRRRRVPKASADFELLVRMARMMFTAERSVENASPRAGTLARVGRS